MCELNAPFGPLSGLNLWNLCMHIEQRMNKFQRENYVGLKILFEASSKRSHQITLLSGARKW